MKTAFVDTNVLLRFLTGEPADLAAQARSLFEAVDRGEINLFVDELVVAEAVWVLESFYGHPRPEIGRTLQALLGHAGLQAADKAGLLTALSLYTDENIDFVDALVAVHMGQQGIPHLFSFDRHFDRLRGVVRCLPGEPV